MVFGKRTYQSINDLHTIRAISNWSSLPDIARAQVKILVVDDKPFESLELLRNNGFQVQHIFDITDLTQLQGYQVIAFDLQGIGITLDPHMQGANLIRRTKKDYPNKYIIAYTGSARDEKLQQAITEADVYVAKDMPPSDWYETLQEAVEQVADPIKVWKKFRHRLLDEGITPIQLANIEDAFVKNYKSGQEKLQQALLDSLKENGVSNQIVASSAQLLSVALKSIVYLSSHA